MLKNILNMDPAIAEDPEFADFASGNKVLEGSVPMAHRYGGHQFGYWARQIGRKNVFSCLHLIDF